MANRTIKDFKIPTNFKKEFDEWSNQEGFKLKKTEGNIKTYQKGIGFLVAPMMLEVKEEGENIHMEMWIRVGFIMRIFALFLVPSEMEIQSGGFRLMAPRKIARTSLNKLFEKIGETEIE